LLSGTVISCRENFNQKKQLPPPLKKNYLDVVVLAKSLHKFNISRLIALETKENKFLVLKIRKKMAYLGSQNAETSLTTIESLHTFVETASKTSMLQSLLQDLLEGGVRVVMDDLSDGLSSNFLNSTFNCISFYVRHPH
jgi:hypothetical protein